MNRLETLKGWVQCLEDIDKEFPGSSTSIGTAINSFKTQIKELEK
jgi:hypothetical protein